MPNISLFKQLLNTFLKFFGFDDISLLFRDVLIRKSLILQKVDLFVNTKVLTNFEVDKKYSNSERHEILQEMYLMLLDKQYRRVRVSFKSSPHLNFDLMEKLDLKADYLEMLKKVFYLKTFSLRKASK